MHGGAVTITCCCAKCQGGGVNAAKAQDVFSIVAWRGKGREPCSARKTALLGRSRQNLPQEMQGAANATARDERLFMAQAMERVFRCGRSMVQAFLTCWGYRGCSQGEGVWSLTPSAISDATEPRGPSIRLWTHGFVLALVHQLHIAAGGSQGRGADL